MNGENFRLKVETLEEAHVPRAFWEFGSDTFPFSNALLMRLRPFATEQGIKEALQGLTIFITGPPDSGKTFLATCLLKMFLCSPQVRHGYYTEPMEATYLNAPANFAEFESNYGVDVLVLDNLEPPPNDFDKTKEAISRLFRLRKDHHGLFIVVSPLNRHDLAAEFRPVVGAVLEQAVEIVCCEPSGIQRRRMEARIAKFTHSHEA